MKLFWLRKERDLTGLAKFKIEHQEDFWHLYNLITIGDQITAKTFRKVQSESATGHVESQRIKVTLTLSITSIEFEPSADVLFIRINGKNVREHPLVKLGAFHTIELDMGKQFNLFKYCWDIIAMERLNEATNPSSSADIAAILMQEGLANICLITSSMTIPICRIETAIARKRKGSVSQHDKALERFFQLILNSILQHLKFDVLKCCLIASPGFVKDQFWEFLQSEATRRDIKSITSSRDKFVLCHSFSAHKHEFKTIASNPAIASKLSETKAAGEVKALCDFFQMMKKEPDRVCYGWKHVHYSNEQQAIQTLLVVDELFRTATAEKRRTLVRLVDSIRNNGGQVKMFSTMHVSGEQLRNLTGLAAILRFPLPLDDIIEGEDEQQQQ
eukprot:TRINITY_DN8945_c0_g1_i1.p1 TRINITY_DN8945_c0_g1~~TRINITY_DN8945_c0_g1_i1.p1  ORF type:complete len:388 (-),score=168.39 TRINITY_DN8945_c0_g1_i1:69-1232(-)